jgi:hypothetical protein
VRRAGRPNWHSPRRHCPHHHGWGLPDIARHVIQRNSTLLYLVRLSARATRTCRSFSSRCDWLPKCAVHFFIWAQYISFGGFASDCYVSFYDVASIICQTLTTGLHMEARVVPDERLTIGFSTEGYTHCVQKKAKRWRGGSGYSSDGSSRGTQRGDVKLRLRHRATWWARLRVWRGLVADIECHVILRI